MEIIKADIYLLIVFVFLRRCRVFLFGFVRWLHQQLKLGKADVKGQCSCFGCWWAKAQVLPQHQQRHGRFKEHQQGRSKSRKSPSHKCLFLVYNYLISPWFKTSIVFRG